MLLIPSFAGGLGSGPRPRLGPRAIDPGFRRIAAADSRGNRRGHLWPVGAAQQAPPGALPAPAFPMPQAVAPANSTVCPHLPPIEAAMLESAGIEHECLPTDIGWQQSAASTRLPCSASSRRWIRSAIQSSSSLSVPRKIIRLPACIAAHAPVGWTHCTRWHARCELRGGRPLLRHWYCCRITLCRWPLA